MSEQTNITANLQTQVLSDDQIAHISASYEQIRQDPKVDNLTQKRQIIEVLDVRGTLAIIDGEKMVSIKCLMGQQLLSVVRTLHL